MLLDESRPIDFDFTIEGEVAVSGQRQSAKILATLIDQRVAGIKNGLSIKCGLQSGPDWPFYKMFHFKRDKWHNRNTDTKVLFFINQTKTARSEWNVIVTYVAKCTKIPWWRPATVVSGV